jgi:ribonuclease D
MVERYLAVRLAKEHSAVDWSTRPLQADWLNYAALDVDVLEALMFAVHADLEAAKKLEIAEQEFDHLLNFKPKTPKTDKWRGTTGLHEVKDQRGLAIARELWMAREELAKRIDVAPGRLIPDLSITAVVKNPPVARSALAEMKSFVGRASRSYLDVWWKALSQGLQTNKLPPVKIPLEGIPHHRNWAQRYPEADARLNRLKPVMARLAEQYAMPSENLLSPDLMRHLCWEPPTEISIKSVSEFLASRKARKWQIDAVAGEFVKALTSPDNLASSESLELN